MVMDGIPVWCNMISETTVDATAKDSDSKNKWYTKKKQVRVFVQQRLKEMAPN